jgi:hypothetical protein
MPNRRRGVLGTVCSGEPIILRPPAPAPAKVGDLRLPNDVSISTPSPGTPADATRFLGGWIGFWGDVLPHLLVVERVAADGTVEALYAVGDAPAWKTARTVSRSSGAIRADRLTIDSPRAQISYEFDPKRRLIGRYVSTAGALTVGVFEPIGIKTLRDSERPVPHPALGESVRIPHLSVVLPDGSRPIELEGTLYRPTRPGVAPLAIINHGSTGGYIVDPHKTFRHEAEALWLLERGFAVLVPMRRGRGIGQPSFSHGSFNTDALCQAAPTARTPQLWLYGEHESHYGAEHIRANHATFVRAGGNAELKIVPVPGDGHFLMRFPDLWRPVADAYVDCRL